ncbi:MAG: TraB/GumN family protein [Terricaulis sp.]
MIKNWLCAALIAAFAGVAHAETPRAAPATEQAAALTPVRPALFVARDVDSEIYLFGTVHLRRPGSEWGGAVAQASLARADEVWTEMDISEANAQNVQTLIFRTGMAPSDRPLSSWLNDSERAELAAAVQSLGAEPEMFERMRPWLAGMVLSVMPMVRDGYDADAGVDQAVTEAAGDTRKRSFETAEQQISFFANLSDDAQREFLLDTIRSANEGTAEMDEMSGAWERGDLVTLERMALDDFRRDYPELFGVLFTQRNEAWVVTLMQELDGAGVDFVAVGAAHLLGEGGLVELLRARGVTIERVE